MLNKLPFLFFILLLSACSSNPIKETWHDPSVKIPVAFSKTLFVAIMDTPANRRITEDTLSDSLQALQGQVSYKLISQAQLELLSQVKQSVLAQDYKHAFLIRWVSSKTELIRQPSAGMSTRSGFWGRHRSAIHLDSSTISSQETVLFELSLYDLTSNQLIWTGNGQIINPNTMTDSAQQLSTAILQQLKQVGMIQ